MTFVKKNYTAGSDKSQLWTRPLFPFPLFDDKIASFCLQFLYVWPKYLLCKLLLEIPISQKPFNFVDLFFGQATPRHVSVRRGRQALAAVARFDLLLLILFGLRVDLSF